MHANCLLGSVLRIGSIRGPLKNCDLVPDPAWMMDGLSALEGTLEETARRRAQPILQTI